MTRAYLDHASSTPIRVVASEAMLAFLRGAPGDPGRLHAEGRAVRVAVEDARAQVAELFGARPREVVFTATGPEAINTAIWGALARGAGRSGRPHVVTTAVEQSAVLDAVRRADAEITIVGVDPLGSFSESEVVAAIRADTTLVSVQLANQEVGTIQTAVAGIVGAARERGVVVHVDACAASGHVPVRFADLGADLCSVDGHTWGAPPGAAALLIRRGLRFPPLVVGGAQERARRAGIENVPAIVGYGAAAGELLADDRLAIESRRATELTDAIARTAAEVPGVTRFGNPDARLPNLVCVGIAGVEAEPVLLALDRRGVAVHSGSACSSEMLEPSSVLRAMGVEADRSLRISVGWSSTDADLERFADAFPTAVHELRALRTAPRREEVAP